MKISRLAATGIEGWNDWAAGLADRATVFHGGPKSGKSTLAQLAAQLLYGKPAGAWRREFAQTTPLVEGSLAVDDRQGRFVLRRVRDGSPSGQLTVAAADGSTVGSATIDSLLGHASPRLLAQLYAADFAAGPRVEELFAPEFARQFNALLHQQVEPAAAGDAGNSSSTSDRQRGQVHSGAFASNKRQLDALVARRDDLAAQLEQALSGRRQHSGDLQRQLAELEAKLDARRQRRSGLLAERQRLQAELAGLTARLRYFDLEAATRRISPGEHDKLQQQLEQLDGEIGRCRQTLAQLQEREAVVRRGLAEVHSDGAAHDADCLADQRATLGVIERLLDDLDAETAQLARAVESDVAPAADAHARLSPVADMLRQQVYALCGQITEQERAVRRHHLQAEARQLTRAQTDLSEQLEQLLAQRQAATHRLRLESHPTVLYPDAPADDHCRCEHHGRFVVESEAMLLGRGDRARGEQDARRGAADLQQQIDSLGREIAELDRLLDEGQRQWNQWQRSRAGLTDSDAIARLKAEIEDVEARIDRQLACGCDRAAPPAADGWRASDILAQLTDGRLVQIRGPRGEQPGEVVDHAGRRRSLEQLTPSERDQAYLAVTLALIASHAAAGAALPLVLDEPFLRQDPADAAAMVGVLANFAAAGRQVVIFTEDGEAARRFQSLGVTTLDVQQQRSRKTTPEPTPVVAPTGEEVSTTRIVRETVAQGSPQLRVTGSWSTDLDPAVFYLTEDAPIDEFPVLGESTARTFGRLEIRTVGDLLQADPQQVAARLDRAEVTAAVVALWQTHMRLMCFVPGVSLNDAQLLATCGVATPGELADVDVDAFAAAVAEFLASPRGGRFAGAAKRYSRSQFHTWSRAAADNRQRWRQSPAGLAWKRYRHAAPRIRSFGRRDSEARSRDRGASARTERSSSRRSSGSSRQRSQRSSRQRRAVRFFLQTSSPVVDAPSIGEKTAALLADVGIRTVSDLLACDAESTAEELSQRRITGEVIQSWQQQARLVCRIPELRGYGAQLLVACGYTEPTQIAGADADELAETIAEYCETKEGERILRGSDTPSVEKIAQWIEHAHQHRSLEDAA